MSSLNNLGTWASLSLKKLDKALGFDEIQNQQVEKPGEEISGEVEKSNVQELDQITEEQAESLCLNDGKIEKEKTSEEVAEAPLVKDSQVDEVLRQRELQIEKQAKHIAMLEEARIQSSSIVSELKKKLLNAKEESEAAIRARDKEISILREEKASLRNISDRAAAADQLLKDKDSQIEAVLSEGRILAEKQSKMEIAMRSLRKNLKDSQAEVEKLKMSHEEEIQNVKALKEKLDKVVLSEKDNVEKVINLKIANERLLKELKSKENEVSELETKFQEIFNRNKILETEISQLREEHFSVTRSISETERKLQERENCVKGREERESILLNSVQDLRLQIEQQQQKSSAREADLLKEIAEIRHKFELSEKRNEELVASIPDATKPLLRQIESLQAQLRTRGENWESLESMLREEIRNTETRARSLENQKKDTELSLIQLRSELSSLKNELTRSQSKSNNLSDLNAKLELRITELVTQKSELESQIQNLNSSLASSQKASEGIQEKLKKELQNALNLASTAQADLNSERSLRLRIESQFLNLSNSTPRDSTTPVDSPSMGTFSHRRSNSNDDFLRNSFNNYPSEKAEVLGGVSSLRSIIRQREGEIVALKGQVMDLEKIRNSLSDQLVEMKTASRRFSIESKKIPELESKILELTVRHEAALEVIGQKEEEVSELRADLQDVKDMFRLQVSELVDQIESLRGKSNDSIG